MRLATPADQGRIEAICNDPLIRVWTAFDRAPMFDATNSLTAPSFCVIGDEGCFVANALDPARYVIHTNLLPEHRGERAVAASNEALALAFLSTDATELMTMVPATVPQARLMARHMGFRLLFTRQKVWPALGALHAVGFFSLSLDEWIMSGKCAASGRAFHERLHGELGLASHPDDAAHDAYVGAAVEMIRAGQIDKAVVTYNRWARFAWYQPIEIVSRSPLRIDIRQCVIRIEGDQFFMEK